MSCPPQLQLFLFVSLLSPPLRRKHQPELLQTEDPLLQLDCLQRCAHSRTAAPAAPAACLLTFLGSLLKTAESSAANSSRMTTESSSEYLKLLLLFFFCFGGLFLKSIFCPSVPERCEAKNLPVCYSFLLQLQAFACFTGIIKWNKNSWFLKFAYIEREINTMHKGAGGIID